MNRLDESRLSEMYEAADVARGSEAHLSNEVFESVTALEASYVEIDRLNIETKDYAELLVKYHAEEARFLQMRAEVATLRKVIEEVKELIPLMQEELESPSLRQNTGNMIMHKIDQALSTL